MVFHIIIFKLISESLLSLYPLFVKKLQLTIMSQIWTRLMVYSFVSLLFINWKIVFNFIFKTDGLLLSLVNLVHIFASYLGFKRLDVSVSYSIFYIYPIFIMLFVNKSLHWSFLIPLIGVIFLAYHKKEDKNTDLNKEVKEKKEYRITIGVLMMILAALTEAGIYWYVHKLDMKNPWNSLFISYFLPLIVMSIILNKEAIQGTGNNKKNLFLGLLGNGIIGVLGYYLRFKSIVNLSPFSYAYLSYFGIIMSYFYGIYFNKEKFSWNRIVGTLIIVIYGLFNYHFL